MVGGGGGAAVPSRMTLSIQKFAWCVPTIWSLWFTHFLNRMPEPPSMPAVLGLMGSLIWTHPLEAAVGTLKLVIHAKLGEVLPLAASRSNPLTLPEQMPGLVV